MRALAGRQGESRAYNPPGDPHWYLRLPATEDKLRERGVIRIGSNARDFKTLITDDFELYKSVIKQAGIKADQARGTSGHGTRAGRCKVLARLLPVVGFLLPIQPDLKESAYACFRKGSSHDSETHS